MANTVSPSSAAEVQAFVKANAGWSVVDGMLVRTFQAKSFLEGLDFIRRAGVKAVEADHGPDIDIRWTNITFRLWTHDAGNAISQKDLSLAAEIQAQFQK